VDVDLGLTHTLTASSDTTPRQAGAELPDPAQVDGLGDAVLVGLLLGSQVRPPEPGQEGLLGRSRQLHGARARPDGQAADAAQHNGWSAALCVGEDAGQDQDDQQRDGEVYEL